MLANHFGRGAVMFALSIGPCQAVIADEVSITGGSERDRARMVEISKSWVRDYVSGNLEGLMAIIHDDAIVMAEGQPTVSGKEQVRAFFAGRVGRPGLRFENDLKEIRINGNWAYVYGEFRLELARPDSAGGPFRHRGRYFALYEKRDDGDWKMLRDIDNAAPAVDQ